MPGADLLDAPVTGSKPHAGSGELTFLVGGNAAALERARPALAVMSKAIHHLGPTGSGALTKLINNFMCGVQVASAAEALAMIERSGLDVTKTVGVLGDGAPGSPLVKTMFTRMTAGDYTPNPRVTTIPGYHAFGAFVGRVTGDCSLQRMRLVNAVIGVLSVAAFFAAARAAGAAAPVARTFQYLFLPVLLPYHFLVYADSISLLANLVTLALMLRGRFALAGHGHATAARELRDAGVARPWPVL